MFGCAEMAAQAFWFDDKAASAALLWLAAANACGLAIIAAKACGLASAACDALALSRPDAAAEAGSEWASSACSAFDAALICAALVAMWVKAEALLPIAATSCGFIMWALLAM